MCRCADEDLPVQKALTDGGSEVYYIKPDLVKHLSLSASKQVQVRLSGMRGKPNIVDVVRLNVEWMIIILS